MRTCSSDLWGIKAAAVAFMSLAMVGGLFLSFGALAAMVSAAPSLTDVTSNITSDETWTVAGSPYVVSGTIRVAAVLTIEPGVVVSFNRDSQLVVQPAGRLLANGAAAQPIQFTSIPGTCYWRGIQLESSNNQINYATLEYASQAIKFDDANNQTITFNTFRHNGGCSPGPNPLSGAIIGETDNSLVQSNVFTDNNTAIYLPRSGGNTLAENVISGTTENALYFPPNPATGSDDNSIVSNTVRHAGRFGIYVGSGVNNLIRGNRLYDNQQGGIGLDDQSATVNQRLTVSHNDVYSNAGPGLYITGTEALEVNDNLIWDNARGVLWDLNNDPATSVISRNVICRNSDYLIRNNDVPTVTAAPNWWGSNDPGAAVQGSVDIDPRLVLTATTAVTSIAADGVSTTTITIILRDGGLTVPTRARTVNVATNRGLVSPVVVTLDDSGEGQTTYTAAIVAGPVVITVTDMCAATPLLLELETEAVATIYLPLILKQTPGQATPTPTPTPTVGGTPRPPLPTPTGTPTPLAYVSDVAADQETSRVFVASPRHNWVYVIEAKTDTISRTVAVAKGPTGLSVLTSTLTNKVFIAHQYGANQWHPGLMVFGVDQTTAHETADGGYVGAAPVKVAANSFNNSRVYVSNYFDKLAVLDGDSGPPEARLGWVEQKGWQGAYGIDASHATQRVYLASRDTGELVIFEGDQDRLLAAGFIPTHVKPPQACPLWSVAVNEETGHVFVPCPQRGRVYVLAEDQVSLLADVAVLERRDGGLAWVVSAADAPWIADIVVPGGVGLGEEGIAVDPDTGRVYITNARNDTLVVLQDGTMPAYLPPAVPVGDQPQGVDVISVLRKVYVGNTGDNTLTVLNALTPTMVITTISLTP